MPDVCVRRTTNPPWPQEIIHGHANCLFCFFQCFRAGRDSPNATPVWLHPCDRLERSAIDDYILLTEVVFEKAGGLGFALGGPIHCDPDHAPLLINCKGRGYLRSPARYLAALRATWR